MIFHSGSAASRLSNHGFILFAASLAIATGSAAQAESDDVGVRTTAATPVQMQAGMVETRAASILPASVAATAELRTDKQFRSLFQSWKKLDGPVASGVIAIPSVHPVDSLSFTSNFGVRSDPFTHHAHMHAGVDIPGPVGTPVYATADGIVAEAERRGGYGNLVDIDHGKGIETRYGHLSRILVTANQRVKRGQLIALMGSTGRSTGSHLHYEVRIDGKAVNPAPFLTSTDYLLAAQSADAHAIPVSDGPAAQD